MLEFCYHKSINNNVNNDVNNNSWRKNKQTRKIIYHYISVKLNRTGICVIYLSFINYTIEHRLFNKQQKLEMSTTCPLIFATKQMIVTNLSRSIQLKSFQYSHVCVNLKLSFRCICNIKLSPQLQQKTSISNQQFSVTNTFLCLFFLLKGDNLSLLYHENISLWNACYRRVTYFESCFVAPRLIKGRGASLTGEN